MKTIKQINEEIEKLLNENENKIEVSFMGSYCSLQKKDPKGGTVKDFMGKDLGNTKARKFKFDNLDNAEVFSEKLTNSIKSYLSLPFINIAELSFDSNTEIFAFHSTVNSDNETPTEEDLQAFKDGETDLFEADCSIEINIANKDKEAFIQALLNANIEVL